MFENLPSFLPLERFETSFHVAQTIRELTHSAVLETTANDALRMLQAQQSLDFMLGKRLLAGFCADRQIFLSVEDRTGQPIKIYVSNIPHTFEGLPVKRVCNFRYV
jgi:hypothetical protein